MHSNGVSTWGWHVHHGHDYTVAFVTSFPSLEVSGPSATGSPGHIKRLRGQAPPHTVHRYLNPVHSVDMSDHPKSSPQPVTKNELQWVCDPFSDEVAQAFLRSKVCSLFLVSFASTNESTQNVEWALDNTFRDTKIEFEDLDGLSWPKEPTSPKVDPDFPPLEPLFGPGKPSVSTTIYEAGRVSLATTPTCSQCGFDRRACQLHPRKLSRSRRSSEININFPPVEVSDPFAFVPIPSGQEQELDWQRTQVAALITRPPSAKRMGGQPRPFRLLELPPEEDFSSIGPPPGLSPPRPGLQPLQGIPFPTLA